MELHTHFFSQLHQAACQIVQSAGYIPDPLVMLHIDHHIQNRRCIIRGRTYVLDKIGKHIAELFIADPLINGSMNSRK
ncbi:Uncharacterised protein [Mycobacteroides abscessus subsp. abscessus]|nr:Uncharacterised protein [Mycobacteroides abscessus subsp. abscessus]